MIKSVRHRTQMKSTNNSRCILFRVLILLF